MKLKSKIDIGIPEAKRQEIAAGLSRLLADSYTLYLKTHKFHWNVTGPMFQALHVMFEEQYTELAMAVDSIAERIRVLGVKAPGSYREFSELTKIREDEALDVSANNMIQSLLEGHEQVVRTAKEVLPLLEGANDEGTVGLLGSRLEVHEKTAWMLRSLLEE